MYDRVGVSVVVVIFSGSLSGRMQIYEGGKNPKTRKADEERGMAKAVAVNRVR